MPVAARRQGSADVFMVGNVWSLIVFPLKFVNHKSHFSLCALLYCPSLSLAISLGGKNKMLAWPQ